VTARREPAPPSAPLHVFTPDPDLPPDPYSHVGVCRCGKPGRAGDEQHPLDAPPLVAIFEESRVLPPKSPDDRSDAIIGERRAVPDPPSRES
jgi:hypothetical protein